MARIYSFAWIFGFTVSSSTYYVLCTFISPHKESLTDIAVYPPRKGDIVSPTENIDGESVDSAEKIPHTSTKEEV
jgi:NCS1 family nucleobase:cation symporter-1